MQNPPLFCAGNELAKTAKSGQTDSAIQQLIEPEAPLTHSQMLTTRRKKQTAKKRLATAAKQEKKLRKENVKAASAEAPAKEFS
jgi:hypothetical protein